MKKDLTLLICCYNQEKLVPECLDSIKCPPQFKERLNVIFIDDASEDGSFKVARSYIEKIQNFKIIRNYQNLGLVSACNEGLFDVRTTHYMRLDADDYLAPDSIEKIFSELESSKEEVVVFGRYDIFPDKTEEIKVSEDIYSWIAGGILFKAEAVKSVQGYSDLFWEEYDLYLKLFTKGFKFKLVEDPIYCYRRGAESLTQDPKTNQEGFDVLLEKWGKETLEKFGDFNQITEYYGVNK